ncbi:MAG: hypothetical protein KME57_25115 [Scytonema hyalinum WJT4-NPBG1]|nr:hypothetical protein [Scytonema hyalinum WJT4-NPBG1]
MMPLDSPMQRLRAPNNHTLVKAMLLWSRPAWRSRTRRGCFARVRCCFGADRTSGDRVKAGDVYDGLRLRTPNIHTLASCDCPKGSAQERNRFSIFFCTCLPSQESNT